MTRHWIRSNVHHIWNSTSSYDFDRITAVDMSSCTNLRNFYPNRTAHGKKWRFSRWRISAILDFRGGIMGSLKSPCTTSYGSSTETIPLNCLVFEKIAFLHFGGRQTNRWTGPLHEAALAIASGGLTRSSVVAERPRCFVSLNIVSHWRSFEMILSHE